MRRRLSKKKKLYPKYFKANYHYYNCNYWIYKKNNDKWVVVNKNATGSQIEKLKNKKGVVFFE